ncbi:Hypothetical protein, putative [Bodo saltans]|uniref:Uncharacterized protein n=1 Tax=Bodo saltans TaxID=75058 RepID=A0A0S4IL61_BODSA|nr:Hypothetical protein, putative [Bodo saltans]|eukprot:CUF21881.1 Hypothetical protein, putative [Bodo saltans]
MQALVAARRGASPDQPTTDATHDGSSLALRPPRHAAPSPLRRDEAKRTNCGELSLGAPPITRDDGDDDPTSPIANTTVLQTPQSNRGAKSSSGSLLIDDIGATTQRRLGFVSPSGVPVTSSDAVQAAADYSDRQLERDFASTLIEQEHNKQPVRESGGASRRYSSPPPPPRPAAASFGRQTGNAEDSPSSPPSTRKVMQGAINDLERRQVQQAAMFSSPPPSVAWGHPYEVLNSDARPHSSAQQATSTTPFSQPRHQQQGSAHIIDDQNFVADCGAPRSVAPSPSQSYPKRTMHNEAAIVSLPPPHKVESSYPRPAVTEGNSQEVMTVERRNNASPPAASHQPQPRRSPTPDKPPPHRIASAAQVSAGGGSEVLSAFALSPSSTKQLVAANKALGPIATATAAASSRGHSTTSTTPASVDAPPRKQPPSRTKVDVTPSSRLRPAGGLDISEENHRMKDDGAPASASKATSTLLETVLLLDRAMRRNVSVMDLLSSTKWSGGGVDVKPDHVHEALRHALDGNNVVAPRTTTMAPDAASPTPSKPLFDHLPNAYDNLVSEVPTSGRRDKKSPLSPSPDPPCIVDAQGRVHFVFTEERAQLPTIHEYRTPVNTAPQHPQKHVRRASNHQHSDPSTSLPVHRALEMRPRTQQLSGQQLAPQYETTIQNKTHNSSVSPRRTFLAADVAMRQPDSLHQHEEERSVAHGSRWLPSTVIPITTMSDVEITGTSATTQNVIDVTKACHSNAVALAHHPQQAREKSTTTRSIPVGKEGASPEASHVVTYNTAPHSLQHHQGSDGRQERNQAGTTVTAYAALGDGTRHRSSSGGATASQWQESATVSSMLWCDLVEAPAPRIPVDGRAASPPRIPHLIIVPQ